MNGEIFAGYFALWTQNFFEFFRTINRSVLTSGYLLRRSCSHTEYHWDDGAAWLVADLGAEYEVDRVALTNREDCCCEYIS